MVTVAVLSSQEALEAVIQTVSSASSDDNIVTITTFPFQYIETYGSIESATIEWEGFLRGNDWKGYGVLQGFPL